MRRFTRRLFSAAAAASLLACAAICELWVRSYAATDSFRIYVGQSWLYVDAACGSFRLQVQGVDDTRLGIGAWSWRRDPGREHVEGQLRFNRSLAPSPWSVTSRFGFTFAVMPGRPGAGPTHFLVAPIPPLALPFTLLPALWLRRRHRERCWRRRVEHGFCGTCGYDIQPTPDRCPECGTVSIVARAKAGRSG